MGNNAVKGIKREVVIKYTVKNTYAMYVVVEVSAGFGTVYLAKVALTCVTEGGVADIVAECDSLDEVEIEVKRRADGTRYTGNELDVKRTSCDIVILVE